MLFMCMAHAVLDGRVYIYIYISLCECVNLTLARLLASWSYSQTQPLLTNLASFLMP